MSKTSTGTSEDEILAIVCHLAPLAGIGYIIAPLVIYLAKKDSPFVQEHAAESLNFQISTLIYGIVSGILCFVLVGFLMLFALGIFSFVVMILATIAAAKGESYHYPLTIRFVK